MPPGLSIIVMLWKVLNLYENSVGHNSHPNGKHFAEKRNRPELGDYGVLTDEQSFSWNDFYVAKHNPKWSSYVVPVQGHVLGLRRLTAITLTF